MHYSHDGTVSVRVIAYTMHPDGGLPGVATLEFSFPLADAAYFLRQCASVGLKVTSGHIAKERSDGIKSPVECFAVVTGTTWSEWISVCRGVQDRRGTLYADLVHKALYSQDCPVILPTSRRGYWHLPYISQRELGYSRSHPDVLPYLSAARCMHILGQKHEEEACLKKQIQHAHHLIMETKITALVTHHPMRPLRSGDPVSFARGVQQGWISLASWLAYEFPDDALDKNLLTTRLSIQGYSREALAEYFQALEW